MRARITVISDEKAHVMIRYTEAIAERDAIA